MNVPYFCHLILWQYRFWSFQERDTKLERFLAKNQLKSNEIWRIGVVTSCQKVPKFDFENFSVKSHPNLSNFLICYLRIQIE